MSTHIKMHIKHLLIAAMAISSLAASAQTTTKLTASKANDFGLVYSLPLTSFDVVIETEFKVRQPGEFYNYAHRYLNSTDAITAPDYSTAIKSVTLVPRGIPDKDNRWMVELKGQGIAYMMLNQADVPVGINTEQTAKIISPTLPVAKKAEPTALETEAAKHAVTQEMAASTSQSKRASLAARRIYELRETRNELISGQAENTPPDGKSLQLALDNLAAQEAALTAMFNGTEKTWTQIDKISFTPDSAEVSDMVIARLSPTKGIVSADDLSGAPIYLNLDITSTGALPTDAAGLTKKLPKEGIAYNIPGTAVISLTYDGAKIYSGNFDIAQLGKKFALDPKLFTDKKAPTYVIFNPLTGGILSLGTLDKQQ